MSLNDIADILWENNFKAEAKYLRELMALLFEWKIIYETSIK